MWVWVPETFCVVFTDGYSYPEFFAKGFTETPQAPCPGGAAGEEKVRPDDVSAHSDPPAREEDLAPHQDLQPERTCVGTAPALRGSSAWCRPRRRAGWARRPQTRQAGAGTTRGTPCSNRFEALSDVSDDFTDSSDDPGHAPPGSDSDPALGPPACPRAAARAGAPGGKKTCGRRGRRQRPAVAPAGGHAGDAAAGAPPHGQPAHYQIFTDAEDSVSAGQDAAQYGETSVGFIDYHGGGGGRSASPDSDSELDQQGFDDAVNASRECLNRMRSVTTRLGMSTAKIDEQLAQLDEEADEVRAIREDLRLVT